jgi:DNA-binding response OmpR family regulator
MSLQCVLVAEDELIIGVDLCDTVEEAGFEVDGPYGTARSAIESLERRKPDLAILDVRLDDGVVYPLADRLLAENVPVIFHSGEVSPAEVSDRYPDAHTLAKPCPPGEIIATMREALAAA